MWPTTGIRDQWENYELAADLTEASSEKRAAVFLTCIGSDAYDVYRSMEFDTVANKKKIDPIIQAFEVFCVGTKPTTIFVHFRQKRNLLVLYLQTIIVTIFDFSAIAGATYVGYPSG